jgi:Spy/CpxP family protein refolding chaperone
MMFLRGANLTADQRSQVQQIIASHRPTFQELFGRLRAAQQELSNRLFSTGGLQEADLAPQVRQISLLRNQIAEENLRVALEIRSVLTPDQLAKAAQLRERMQTLRDEMRNLMMQKESE